MTENEKKFPILTNASLVFIGAAFGMFILLVGMNCYGDVSASKDLIAKSFIYWGFAGTFIYALHVVLKKLEWRYP